MQFVCVESASNVVIEDLRQEAKRPKLKKLPGTYTVAPNKSSKRTHEKPRAA